MSTPQPTPMPLEQRTGTAASGTASLTPALAPAQTFSSVISNAPSMTPSILMTNATLDRTGSDMPPPDLHRAIGDPVAALEAQSVSAGHGNRRPSLGAAFPNRASPRLSPRVPLPGEEDHFTHVDHEFDLGTPVAVPPRRGSTPAIEAGHRPRTPDNYYRPSSPAGFALGHPATAGSDLLAPPRPSTPISSWLEPQPSPLDATAAGEKDERLPIARLATPGDDYVPYNMDRHVEGDNATWHESSEQLVGGKASVGHDLTSKGKTAGDLGGSAERTRRYLVKKQPMGKDPISTIFHSHHPPTNADFVMRVIQKSSLQKNPWGATVESIRKSCDLRCELDHPQVMKLFDWWETDSEFVQILTLVTGGRLIDRIKKYGHFPERDAAIILATLCNTVSYLHAMDIVHRDIRADVVLYKEADPESIMYLGNFDMACHVPEGGVKGEVGTVANAAPEILRRKPYSFPADNWALGIIAYQLLSGAHPFVTGRGTLGETFDRILSGEVGFEGATWALVSPEGKDFVKRLLEQDPAQRMTAAEALDHEWVQLYAPRTYLEWLKSITERQVHAHPPENGVSAVGAGTA